MDGCDGSNFGGFERIDSGDCDSMTEEGMKRENLVVIEKMKFLQLIRVWRFRKARRRRFNI